MRRAFAALIAERKRAEAAQIRRVATSVPLSEERQSLLSQANNLEAEATQLEAQAPAHYVTD